MHADLGVRQPHPDEHSGQQELVLVGQDGPQAKGAGVGVHAIIGEIHHAAPREPLLVSQAGKQGVIACQVILRLERKRHEALPESDRPPQGRDRRGALP